MPATKRKITSQQLERLYMAERVALLYKNAPLSHAITFIVAPLTVTVLWENVSQFHLLAWLSIILLLTTLRLTLYLRYQQAQPDTEQAQVWGYYFLTGLFLAGICWGYSGLFINPDENIQHWFFILFILTGLAGGSLAQFSCSRIAYGIFVIPMLLPLTINTMLAPSDHGTTMGPLILLFLGLTLLLSDRTQKFTDQSLAIRFENTGLLKNLENYNENLLATQKDLLKSRNLLDNVFNATQVLYAHMDNNFNFIQVNKAYAEAGGFNREYFIGRNHFSLYPNEENQKIFKHVVDTNQSFSVRAKAFVYPDHPELGVTYWDWILQPIPNDANEVEELLLTLLDVTQAKQIQIELEEKEQYLRTVMNAAADAIVTMDMLGTIELCNTAVKSIFGYDPEDITGKNINLLIPNGLLQKNEKFFNQNANGDSNTPFIRNLETVGERNDGSEFPIQVTISESHIGNKIIYIGIMHDISAYKSLIDTLNRKNRDLEHLSSHDALTNLYNRRFADQYLQREHKRACRNGATLSVVLIDVDNFKKFNDYYGHQAGDDCLKDVTRAMRSCLKRPSDIIARFGGEEFLVILPETTRDGAIQVTQQLLASVQNLQIPHVMAASTNIVTISAGISVLMPEIDCSYEKLIASADQALYISKQNGRNQYHCLQHNPNPHAD